MKTVDIKDIIPDANQPRKYFAVEKMASLKNSIRKHGIINPLVVQKSGSKYMLIDGERRFRAASDLKLKEVPVNIVEEKGDFERMLEQFHIQEQHEEWTQAEKAMAIMEIANLSKKSIKDICNDLDIDKNTALKYIAFAKLRNKDLFMKATTSLSNAEYIRGVINLAKRIKETELDESFSLTDSNSLEKVLIKKLGNSELNERSSFTRIKDSFVKNPKLIDKFIKDADYDVDSEFIKSKAKGMASLRNLLMVSSFAANHARIVLDNEKVVKLSTNQISILKTASELMEKVLKIAE